MPKQPLFSDGAVDDIAYRNIRDAQDGHLKLVRARCEKQWEVFEPYADDQFLRELRSNFDARYWEMYLTVALIELGYEVHCPKPGPDVGIIVSDLRIWFEATSPRPGAEDHPDRVPPMQFARIGEKAIAQTVPNEQMVLRYLNCISDKCKNQYPRWLERGVVAKKDAFLVAINPKLLGHEYGDTLPPRILQAGYRIGPPYAVIDAKTGKQVDAGYHFRDAIKKAGGENVATGVFMHEEYTMLSGLLCSRVDAANQPNEMAGDFQLAPNPNGRIQLPKSFRLSGTYFRPQSTKDGFNITSEEN